MNRHSPTTSPMRKYLSNAKPGDVVETVFMLSNKQLSTGKDGKQFMKGFLGDKTAQATMRMWGVTPQEASDFPPDGFVGIKGKVENYQNNLQIIVERFWSPEAGSYDMAELVPCTTKDVPTMFKRLTELVTSLKNKHLRALVDAYLADTELMEKLQKAPAAQSMHHAFYGGLLEHTLNVIEVANVVCPFYPGLNRDLVIAGIFLHDIGKTWELSYDAGFGYTDGGHLIGHIVKSAMWVEEKRKIAEAKLGGPIPQNLIDVLQHLILAHHGKLEFGSPKLPMTPEAIAIHMMEDMDAKVMSMLSICRGTGAVGQNNFTDWIKQFDGRLYRPDVAPPDEQPVELAKVKFDNPLFESVERKRGQ